MLERSAQHYASQGLPQVAQVLRGVISQYGDVALPGEAATQVARPEFNADVLAQLTQEGLAVSRLNPQSLDQLRAGGLKMWSTWHRQPEYRAVEQEMSRAGDVAIDSDPRKFFLPRSEGRSLADQLELLAEANERFERTHPGAQLVLGSVPDYLNVTDALLKSRGARLFGSAYGYNYTRTTTQVGSKVASVGYFNVHGGIDVDAWFPQNGVPSLRVAPLVVPKA